MLKSGIIGVGGISRKHHNAIVNHPEMELVGICDVNKQVMKQRAEEWDTKAYPDYHELIDACDVIVVCTPPAAHAELTIAAAEAGKHVLCEKPMALTLRDADAMIAAAEKSGIALMIGHNPHFVPSSRTMWEVFDSGKLGDLIYCWIKRNNYFSRAGWEGRIAQKHWRLTHEESGGRLFEQIHMINFLVWVGGEPVSACGHMATLTDGIEVDEFDVATLNFHKGFAHLELSMTPCTVRESSAGILGTKGSIVQTGDGLRMRLKYQDQEQEVPATAELDMYEHLVDCIRTGRKPENDGLDGRMTLAGCIAFYESARSGTLVRVDEL
jgi:UDP-N-acetyl-2-amino-2-deoxyglucuronate dehydrogenase